MYLDTLQNTLPFPPSASGNQHDTHVVVLGMERSRVGRGDIANLHAKTELAAGTRYKARPTNLVLPCMRPGQVRTAPGSRAARFVGKQTVAGRAARRRHSTAGRAGWLEQRRGERERDREPADGHPRQLASRGFFLAFRSSSTMQRDCFFRNQPAGWPATRPNPRNPSVHPPYRRVAQEKSRVHPPRRK